MKSIIVYNKNINLKSKLHVHLETSGKVNCTYLSHASELLKQVNKDHTSLVLFFTNQLDTESRILISSLRKQVGKTKVCVISDRVYAMDAWNLDLFHFISNPITESKLSKVVAKYTDFNNEVEKKLAFKTKDGIVKVKLSNINYIQADGNYSVFHIRGNKKITQTAKIKSYQDIVKYDTSFTRVHRSFILNLNNINKIDKQEIFFTYSDKSLRVSKNLVSKIKKLLLGYD